jgi:hypothetical protein
MYWVADAGGEVGRFINALAALVSAARSFCVFRRKPTTHFGGIRPAASDESDQPFRSFRPAISEFSTTPAVEREASGSVR